MRSQNRAGRAGSANPPRRPGAGLVGPAALRLVQEADATMTPDGWEADYSGPGFLAEAPAASPVFSLAGALPKV